MASSAGIIVTNGKKILGLYPANKDGWDIPKGKREEGELDIDCAIRECEEETGIQFSKRELEDFGTHNYSDDTGRNLHAFVNFCKKLPSVSDLSCSGYKEMMNYRIPEIKKYEYIDVDKIKEKFMPHISPILVKIMEQINNG